MQSRYVLALCAFALLVAVVSAQQSGQQPSGQPETLIEKLREQAERFIHEYVENVDAAVTCLKEARESCKGLLKRPIDLIKYIRCSVKYIRDNEARCKKQAERQ